MSFSLRLSSLEKRLNPAGTSANALEQQPCGLCGRQFAKYTCPTCNTPYCSLTCFRSEAHSQCTEPFYKQSLEDEIKAGPSRTKEEKQAMLDMLKRFEEQSRDLGDEGSDDEDGEDGWAEKRAELDLDSADSDKLWNTLSPEQQAKFSRLLQNPDSQAAKALLASAGAQEDVVLPWWEMPPSVTNDDEGGDEESGERLKYGREPEMMNIPESLVEAQQAKRGPVLAYNVLAVAIVYSYATRHFEISPLSSVSKEGTSRPGADSIPDEVAQLVVQTLPFLADRRSTLVFHSIESVVTDLWSRFPSQEANHELFVSLLQDTATLLAPSKVSELRSTPSPNPKSIVPSTATLSSPSTNRFSSHSSWRTLLVLSDLHALLLTRNKAAAMKLQYYAAHMLGLPPQVLDAVCDEAVHYDKYVT